MSTLTIMLLTYGRLDYAIKTLESTLGWIEWPGDLRVHIASDGDSDAYINTLADLARNSKRAPAVSISNSNRRGYGANYNLGTQVVHEYSDYVLPLEDDWILMRSLYAENFAETLDALGGVACLRLGYLGFTQSLLGEFIRVNGQRIIRLDENSPEPHVFAGHPRIETKAWERFVGPWPEDLSPGETEFAVAHNPNARKYVYWPIDSVAPCGDLFAHIGTRRAGE